MKLKGFCTTRRARSEETDWEESFLSHISDRDNTQNYTHMVVVGNREKGGREKERETGVSVGETWKGPNETCAGLSEPCPPSSIGSGI